MKDKFYLWLVLLFCAINGLGIAYSHILEKLGIVNLVGMIGNVVLAGVSVLSYYFHRKAMKTQSNHAFIRYVYSSSLLKLVLCLIGIGLYVYFYRSHVSLATILFLMLLYIIYTILEVFNLLQIAKSEAH